MNDVKQKALIDLDEITFFMECVVCNLFLIHQAMVDEEEKDTNTTNAVYAVANSFDGLVKQAKEKVNAACAAGKE